MSPDPSQPAPPSPGAAERGLGGIIHTYQKYDPKNFPPPTSEPPDLASAAMEHMLTYGNMRRFTPEELANAIRLDPSQISGFGPSIEHLLAMLRERKEKILSTYEITAAQKQADFGVAESADGVDASGPFRKAIEDAIRQGSIADLENVYDLLKDDTSPTAGSVMRAIHALATQYEVEELASKYTFTGRTELSAPDAIEIKGELESIDRLIKQLEEAMKNAQLAIVDLEQLSEFASEEEMQNLANLQKQIDDYLKAEAERQGIEQDGKGFTLTPQAMRLFQGKVLQEIFSNLQAARSGRHDGPILGEGPVELAKTKAYEFGDSVTSMDVGSSFVNAMLRRAANPHAAGPFLHPSDIEIHRTRNSPKCATVVLLDMSGSMRHDGQYINAKRMALALDGLIRREYPGDFLAFIECYTFAKVRHISEIPGLMPKPVTIHQPVVRLRADMSKPEASELAIPPHFTNLQHGLQLARQILSAQDTPNQQIIMISDGLPTAHYEGDQLFMLYPPDPRTEEATMREARAAAKNGITINFFLLPSWWQTSEDVAFAHRLAQETKGRVFFTGGSDLDRFVLWDYINNRRQMLS